MFHVGHDQADAVTKAEAWTAEQAERLGVTPREILDTVARGWLPPDIKLAKTKYHLEGENNGLAVFRAQIRNAPIRPIKRKPPKPSNWDIGTVRHGEQVAAPENTATADAFKQAAE